MNRHGYGPAARTADEESTKLHPQTGHLEGPIRPIQVAKTSDLQSPRSEDASLQTYPPSYLQPRLQILQRSIGNRGVQQLLALHQDLATSTHQGSSGLTRTAAVQRQKYRPKTDDVVTKAKTYNMKSYWYQAALVVIKAQLLRPGLNRVQRKKLRTLRDDVAKELKDTDQTKVDASSKSGVIKERELEEIFPKDLPKQLYTQIADAAEVKKMEIREDLRNAYIRYLNNSVDWKPIERQINFGSTKSPDNFTSTITPVNEHYHETYGNLGKQYGHTGLNSMSSAKRLTKDRDKKKENSRTTNLAYTELRSGGPGQAGGKVVFAAFRSGALSGKDLPQDNRRATKANALELLEAMTIKHLQGLSKDDLEGAINGVHQTIPVTSISLQSVGVREEAAQIHEQLEILRKISGTSQKVKVRWASSGDPSASKIINVKFDIIALNLGVNAQGDFSTKGLKKAINRLREAVIQYARTVPAAIVRANQAEKAEIEEKNQQILVLWEAILGELGATKSYKLASRIANLAFLLGQMVHFNCKSGKDRTGLMDVESKYLALRMEQLRRRGISPTKDQIEHTLTEDQQASYQKMLFESGNLEMQEYNTGGQGYKIAPAKEILPADMELTTRVGGNDVLTLLQGLKRYTDIDKI